MEIPKQANSNFVPLEDLENIVSKRKEADLSISDLENLFYQLQPEADSKRIHYVTKILTYQLKQNGVNSYYIFNLFLHRVFIYHDSLYLNVFRNMLKEVHFVKYTLPNTEQIIDFKVNKEQLDKFFVDKSHFITSYASYLLSADPSLLSWLHYYFWDEL